MLKTPKKESRKVVASIKNNLTKSEMSRLDDEWVSDQTPLLTLQDVLATKMAVTEGDQRK